MAGRGDKCTIFHRCNNEYNGESPGGCRDKGGSFRQPRLVGETGLIMTSIAPAPPAAGETGQKAPKVAGGWETEETAVETQTFAEDYTCGANYASTTGVIPASS